MTSMTKKFSTTALGATVRVVTLALFLGVFAAGAALAQTKAYVSNNNGQSVSVLDTTTNTVTATIAGGASPAFIAFQPAQSPQAQLAALISQVESLISAGGLTQNQGNTLINKLNQIGAKLDAAQTGAACNQLGAFANQVNAFVNNGSLTQAQGQALINAVNPLRTNLGC